jgi:hypothetical protein
MNKLFGLMGVLGAAAIAAGCSVETEGPPAEGVSEVSEALMCSGDSKFKTEATLAAVMAKELGRWEPQLDFWEAWWGGLALTQAAFDRCYARGFNGCPNTMALLQLQWNGTPEIPNHYEDQYRNILVAHYREYMSFWQNNRLPLAESVDLNYDTSNSEVCDDGDGTFDMHWYKVNLPPDKLSFLKWKLAAFGSRPMSSTPENPFLNFTVAEGKVGIDPTNSLVNGTSSTTSGSCSTSSVKVSTSTNYTGTCCYVSGKYSTYQRSSWDTCTYLCKY